MVLEYYQVYNVNTLDRSELAIMECIIINLRKISRMAKPKRVYIPF